MEELVKRLPDYYVQLYFTDQGFEMTCGFPRYFCPGVCVGHTLDEVVKRISPFLKSLQTDEITFYSRRSYRGEIFFFPDQEWGNLLDRLRKEVPKLRIVEGKP